VVRSRSTYAFSRNVAGIVITMMERDLATMGIELPDAQVMQGSAATSSMLDNLITETDHPGSNHDAAMRAHLTLLLIALNRHRQHIAPAAEADRARLHANAFRQLVARRFRETRRIGDYAREIGLSQTHLNRICRQELGGSALEIIERRIALEARRQLLFSSLTIKQIGAELGYDDPAYFTRFVIRRLGASPTAIRLTSRLA
jgi:AraC family transcriptional regulator, transcriptional activator of pobA